MNSKIFSIYVSSILAGIIFIFLIFYAEIICILGVHGLSGRWAGECLITKNQIVKSLNPKLIILSGSNGLFGFSAEKMTEKYNILTVNASIHAGLGLKYILHYGKAYFAKDRILILPLEYELYEEKEADFAQISQVLEYDKDYFIKMNFINKVLFTANIQLFSRISLLRDILNPDRTAIGGYNSKTLNKYGDETVNVLSADSIKLSNLNSLGCKIYKLDDNMWREIVNFANEAKFYGCQVVLTYPNIYDKCFNFEGNKSFFENLKNKASKDNIILIGDPLKATFPDKYLYDTIYHENNTGREVSTNRLYNDINSARIIH